MRHDKQGRRIWPDGSLITEEGKKYYDDTGRQICGSQLGGREDGVRCRQPPVRGAIRCRRHGGNAAIGPARSNYKDGRTSRYAGTHRLQSRYDRALADDDYMNMRPELAMIDAMLSERWELLEKGGNDDLWEVVQKQFIQLKGALAGGDVRKSRAVLTEMEYVIDQGNSERLARKEIRELIRDRTKLVSEMHKAMVQLRQVITVEQMLGMMSRVIGVVEANVSDRHEVAKVMREIQYLSELPEPKNAVDTVDMIASGRGLGDG